MNVERASEVRVIVCFETRERIFRKVEFCVGLDDKVYYTTEARAGMELFSVDLIRTCCNKLDFCGGACIENFIYRSAISHWGDRVDA